MTYTKFKEPVEIYGSGIYTPETVITPEDLENVVKNFDSSKGTYSDFCRRHFGTGKFHEARYETTSSMLAKAGRNAIQDAGILDKDIAAVVFATITPDDRIAGVRSLALEKMGLYDIESHEIRAACAAFISTLKVGHGLVNDTQKYVLLIGGDKNRGDITNTEDFMYSGLVADGSAAVVIGPGEEGYGFLDSNFATNYLWYGDAKQGSDRFFSMIGKSLKERVGPLFLKYIKESIKKNNLDPKTIITAVHQVNGVLIDGLASALSEDPEINLDKKRVINVFKDYSNIASGSMFLALHHALKSGLVRRDIPIIGAGVGAGFDHGYYTYKSSRDLHNKKNLRILVVDDEEKALEVVKDVLERWQVMDKDIGENYALHIDLASSSNNALTLVGKTKYDLFIVDQRMPQETGGKGTELIEKLREFQDTKAIIHSGASEQVDLEKMVSDNSILKFIPKPLLQGGIPIEEQPNLKMLKEIIQKEFN